MEQWSSFVGSIRERPAPRQAQVRNVLLCNLPQRAEPPTIGAPPPREPFAGGRIPEHRIGHRRVSVQRVSSPGSWRNGDATSQTSTGTAGEPWKEEGAQLVEI